MNINPEKIELLFVSILLSELSKGHVFKDMVTDIKHVGDDLSLKGLVILLRAGNRKLEMKSFPI